MMLKTDLRALLLVPLTAAAIIRPDNINSLRTSYDYIIIGGGTSGLTVANRLTEDASINVLVIEAGTLDDGSPTVMAPGSIATTSFRKFNWNYRTVPQTFIDGETHDYPLGKMVGGGTILNGMAWTRASAANYDSWAKLGNPGWGWDGILPYFKKSETYNDKTTTYGTNALGIAPDAASHGRSGPVQVGYPWYMYSPQSESFLNAAKAMGIPRVGDLNTGNATGAGIVPSSISYQKQRRSSARTAYLDPVVNRPNLHVAIEQRVTRILLDNATKPKATGIEFAWDAASQRRTVKSTREVILAAGAIFSPVLLQVSGIGPRPVLDSIGVKTRVDLPGVGNNLQDHPMLSPAYKYTAKGLYTARNLTGAENQARLQQWSDKATGPYTCPMVNAVAFPAFPWVTSDYARRLENARKYAMTLPTNDDSLRKGYQAQLTSILDLLTKNSVGAFELWSSSVGDLTVSLMQPLSRGNVTAPSKNIFDMPKIDPRFCSHPFDCEVLGLGVGFIDKMSKTQAMKPLAAMPLPGFTPGGDIRNAINVHLRTDFHPTSSTAMLPRANGGVVDPSLRVYGTQGLRVVDAGIMPTITGGHLVACVYAIAEKAADLIKRDQAATGGLLDDVTGALTS